MSAKTEHRLGKVGTVSHCALQPTFNLLLTAFCTEPGICDYVSGQCSLG